MKINFKLLIPLLLILILSISAVSAANLDTESSSDVTVEDFNDNINIDTSLSTTDVKGNTYIVNETTDFATIQSTINNAQSGDTIIFEKGTYGNNSNPANFAVPHGIIFQGNGATIYGGNTTAIFNVQATSTTDITGTSFYNFNFIMTGDTPWNGRGVQINNGKDSIIDNCTFINGNAGIYSKGSTNIVISNCYFTGKTNESTIGGKEVGTKAINIMGSKGLTIKNCNFEGELLDGVSIASNSRAVIVENNNFNGNYYGIFFGGGSNGTITANTFNSIKRNAINMAKASSQTTITNNTFNCLDNTNQIYLEQGNTEHGTPTNIGSVYILNNVFQSSSNPATVNAVYVLSNGGPLEVQGEFIIKDNTLYAGMDLFTFFDKNWGNSSEINISESAKQYYLIDADDVTLYYRNGSEYVVTLTEATGEALALKDINVNINGIDYTFKTDEDGEIHLPIGLAPGIYNVTSTFNGKKGSVTVKNTITVLSTISGEDLELYYRNGSVYQVKAIDGNGQPLTKGTPVTLNINGVFYYPEVDENGVASLPIGLNPGNYIITAQNPINGEMISNNVIVKSFLEANDTTVVSKKGAFVVKVLDKVYGNPLANANVKININGVIYDVISDTDGLASLPIGLNPGQYIATAEYDGLRISKTVTVTSG